MGGRGSYSITGYGDGGVGGGGTLGAPLPAYAVASLNRDTAKGTTPEAAIQRFREQLMNQKYEYSAFVDDAGYVHSMTSAGKEGSTGIAPLASVAKEKGVSTIVHNHPHGGSDGRKWGGCLSGTDLETAATMYRLTGGKVNKIVATSNEGTYIATVKKSIPSKTVKATVEKARTAAKKKEYGSELAMWRGLSDSYTKAFAKVGISIEFIPGTSKSAKFVTQQTGYY
jgi:hypothetical protein